MLKIIVTGFIVVLFISTSIIVWVCLIAGKRADEEMHDIFMHDELLAKKGGENNGKHL